MVFTQIAGTGSNFISWKTTAPGEEFVGQYNGMQEGRFGLEVSLTTDKGNTIMPAAGQLKWLLNNRKDLVGKTIKIVYTGKTKVAINGKKVDVNQFELFVGDENE